MLATRNVVLYTVEVAFGDRAFEVTESANPHHLQLRTNQEIWHKENAINLGVKHLLPANWKYVCWADADIQWLSPNWALETIHSLQHHHVVQPWSECADQNPYGGTTQLFRSFTSLVSKGVRQQANTKDPYPYGHSGFSVAFTRVFWENVGGLMDGSILGSGDHHMMWGVIGKIDYSVHQEMTDAFKKMCTDWETNAFRVTNGFVGYTPGTIIHAWHGQKRKRFYRERWAILVDNKFDPSVDLRKDAQGLYTVVGKPQLLQDCHEYFKSRDEDGVSES